MREFSCNKTHFIILMQMFHRLIMHITLIKTDFDKINILIYCSKFLRINIVIEIIQNMYMKMI